MENTMNEEVMEMTEEVAKETAAKLTAIKPEGKWVAVGIAIGAAGIGTCIGIKNYIDRKKAGVEGKPNPTEKKSWKDKISKLPKLHKKPKETTSTEEVKPEELN